MTKVMKDMRHYHKEWMKELHEPVECNCLQSSDDWWYPADFISVTNNVAAAEVSMTKVMDRLSRGNNNSDYMETGSLILIWMYMDVNGS